MDEVQVLVVDDEPAILQSTSLLLRELGYRAATLSDASRILPTLRELRPRLLLQDVRMPGLDVARLVSSMRADPALARIRVVLFSAGMDLDQISAAVGAAGLEKPFRPAELAMTVAAALR